MCLWDEVQTTANPKQKFRFQEPVSLYSYKSTASPSAAIIRHDPESLSRLQLIFFNLNAIEMPDPELVPTRIWVKNFPKEISKL